MSLATVTSHQGGLDIGDLPTQAYPHGEARSTADVTSALPQQLPPQQLLQPPPQLGYGSSLVAAPAAQPQATNSCREVDTHQPQCAPPHRDAGDILVLLTQPHPQQGGVPSSGSAAAGRRLQETGSQLPSAAPMEALTGCHEAPLGHPALKRHPGPHAPLQMATQRSLQVAAQPLLQPKHEHQQQIQGRHPNGWQGASQGYDPGHADFYATHATQEEQPYVQGQQLHSRQDKQKRLAARQGCDPPAHQSSVGLCAGGAAPVQPVSCLSLLQRQPAAIAQRAVQGLPQHGQSAFSEGGHQYYPAAHPQPQQPAGVQAQPEQPQKTAQQPAPPPQFVKVSGLVQPPWEAAAEGHQQQPHRHGWQHPEQQQQQQQGNRTRAERPQQQQQTMAHVQHQVGMAAGPAAGAGQAPRRASKQAVLLSTSKFTAPPPDPPPASAWQKPKALQVVNAKPDRSRMVQKRPASTLTGDSGKLSYDSSAAAAAPAPGGSGRGGGTAAAGASPAAGATGGSNKDGAKKKGSKPRPKVPASKAAAVPAGTAAPMAADDSFLAADGSDDEFERPQQRGLKHSAAPGTTVPAAKAQLGQKGGARKASNKAGSGGVDPAKGAGDKPKKGRTKPQQPSKDKGTPAPQQLPPQQDAETSGRKKARKSSKAGPAAGVADAQGSEELKFLATGAVEACSTLGFQRFAAEMDSIPSCSIGMLLVDATGTQFFSSLEPLTKEQLQRIKALQGGGIARKKKKAGDAAEEEPAPAPATNTDDPAASTAAAPSGAQPVALCLLPIHLSEAEGAGQPGQTIYYIPLAVGAWGGGQPVTDDMACRGRELVGQLLSNQLPVVCFNMQGVLRALHSLGLAVPPPQRLSLIDPRLLAWLAEPQLVQRAEKELEDYGLQELLARHLPGNALQLQAAGGLAADPLSRMRAALTAAMRLGEHLHGRLLPAMPFDTIQREMQVSAMLAEMGTVGLGLDPWMLLQHGQVARGHLKRIEQEAAKLAGREFNLSSASQIADVLYNTLGLPAPTAHGRGSAKTHLPTDEAALAQLKPLSPLPGLILEYRALQNFLSKWVDADWVRQATGGWPTAEARLAALGDWPRVRCSWNQTATATGRLSSSTPNLQAVTKYQLETTGQEQTINVRDAFVASHGCMLLAADYSQVELRVLAHLSGDAELIRLLRQAGAAGDAFQLIASMWLGSGSVGAVSKQDREKAKRVCYGIIYGLTAWGLAQQQGTNLTKSSAQALINSFLDSFPGVRSYLEQVKAAARQEGCVRTLAGRTRPIKGLTASDNRARAEAERKAVNTTVQGSAADIMKAAMVGWAAWHEAQGRPPVSLVGQIHDELIFEVDTSQLSVEHVAQAVRDVMEGVIPLAVPLIVNIKAGERWGSMQTVAPTPPQDMPPLQQQHQQQQQEQRERQQQEW
ncbi:hypothetical protein N2152v2_000321 [Parachlorella kessleri]